MANRSEGYIKFRCEWRERGPWLSSKGKLRKLIARRDQLKRLGLIGVYPPSRKTIALAGNEREERVILRSRAGKDTAKQNTVASERLRPDGIGFGNVSVRAGRTLQFFITGSQTGHIRKLALQHCTKVVSASIAKNQVVCEGPIKASSESLTHFAVYKASPFIKAVIHVHWPELWRKMIGKLPTTRKTATYGTPAMGKEILRLMRRASVFQDTSIHVIASSVGTKQSRDAEIALPQQNGTRNDEISKSGIILMGGHKDGILVFGVTLEAAFRSILRWKNLI